MSRLPGAITILLHSGGVYRFRYGERCRAAGNYAESAGGFDSAGYQFADENGLMLTRALRERSTVGIILVTGRGDRIDRIVGLEMGADDYVTKPLELRELVVRVKNLLWRIDLARQAQPHTQDNCYRFAGYCLNVSRHTLEQDGEPIKLTRAEYEMLVAFVTNPGEILSRERLLRMLSARRVENPDLRTVDVLIRRLRHKLSADLLVTQHGEGYFLAADVC